MGRYDIEHVKPEEIEKRSFEIITKELNDMGITLDEEKAPVIKRCIHTSADFEYAKTLMFSEGAIDEIKRLIKAGATIVTDTNMAMTGINKTELSKYCGQVICYMADVDVAKVAKERGVTRASVSMERAFKIDGPVIFVSGNAPTALITIRDYYDKGIYKPAFVIGVPVGFVNVEAAKEMIMDTDIPYIINKGRKGGSNVAAAIVNAILYMLKGEDN